MRDAAAISKKRAEIRAKRQLHPYAVPLGAELGLILVYPFLTMTSISDEVFRTSQPIGWATWK